MSLHFWLLVFPDIEKPIGGVKQMHRLCECLISLGHKATIVQDNAAFHPQWFASDVPTISQKEWFVLSNLSPLTDYIILPETFVSGIPFIKPGLPKIIFNQNSSYTFGLLDKPIKSVQDVFNLYHHPDIAAVWCISDYDFHFIDKALAVPSNILHKLDNPIGIDHLLPPSGIKKKKKIAYMPRKNKRDSDIVIGLLKSRYPDWNFSPIQNCSHEAVIDQLLNSICFLSFGHPEGFGLPVAEAMICGCFVIGYSGLGGRELFNYPSTKKTSVEVQFGDIAHFVDATIGFIDSCSGQLDSLFIKLSKSSCQICASYSALTFTRSLQHALNALISV